MTLAALIGEIDANRPRESSLSSALRLFVLEAAKHGGLAASLSDAAVTRYTPKQA